MESLVINGRNVTTENAIHTVRMLIMRHGKTYLLTIGVIGTTIEDRCNFRQSKYEHDVTFSLKC